MPNRCPERPGRFTTTLAGLGKSLVDFVLPPLCPLCGRLIESSRSRALCPTCLSKVPFIEPPFCLKCGIPFASDKEESHLCGRCLQANAIYGMARAVCRFSGPIREAIHGFKYERKTYLSQTLVSLMEERPPPVDMSDYDRLVPVPLHKNRLRQRGYNQTLLLAREMTRRFGVPVDLQILARTRDALPQIALTGSSREENVRGVFSLGGDPDGKTLLLIDDVYTTGATVRECAKVLIRGGAKRVDILTVARAI